MRGAKWVGERTRVGGKQFPSACAVRREKLSRGGHKDRAEDGVRRTQREPTWMRISTSSRLAHGSRKVSPGRRVSGVGGGRGGGKRG